MDMLKQQGEEHDTFLQTMAEQLTELQNVCNAEFIAVETAYREVSSSDLTVTLCWLTWCTQRAIPGTEIKPVLMQTCST